VDVVVGMLTGALVLLGVTLAGRLWVVIRRWGGSAMRSEKT